MSKRYRRKSIKIPKKILLLFFAILIAILAVILTRTQNSSSAQVAQQRKGLTEEQIEELKDSIMVEEVNIIGRATGTEPFTQVAEGEEIPDVPGAGEDYSDSDDYVRTGDIVSYSINVTTGPNINKEGIDETTILYGGIIKVKATLPNQGEDPNMTWELDAWMENVQISEDGTELYAEYTIPESEISCPKTQQLTFTYLVGGEILEVTEDQNPIFEVWMDGNKPDNEESLAESVKVQDTSSPIKISATQNFNIKLSKGDWTQKYTNEDYSEDGGEQNGYYMNFGIAAGIAQEDNSISDLRGLEYPKGTFEVKLKLEYLYSNGTEWIPVDEDTANSLGAANGAILVGYSINGEKNEAFWPNESIAVSGMPNGKESIDINNPERNAYDSGNISVTLENGILTIVFEDFDFGEEFPSETRGGSTFEDTTRGYFSIGNIELFVPFYDETSSYSEYQLNIDVIEATYSTGTVSEATITTNDNNTFEDVDTADNRLNYAMTRDLDGSVSYSLQIRDENNGIIESENLSGDGIRGLRR